MRRPAQGAMAFTLIELMVVVAIILILAGMLFSIVPNVREKGRDAQCKSNLKQLQVATMSFVSDKAVGAEMSLELPPSDSTDVPDMGKKRAYEKQGWVTWVDYPADGLVGRPSHPLPPWTSWQPNMPRWWGTVNGVRSITNASFFDYVGRDLSIYLCPSFDQKRVRGLRDPDANSLFGADNPVVRNYGMNTNLSAKALAQVKNASRYLLFADMHLSKTNLVDGKRVCAWGLRDKESEYWRPWDGSLEGGKVPGQSYPYESVGDYHDGFANAVFLDGHIERLSPTNTIDACAGNW